jgi:hypothetical protein
LHPPAAINCSASFAETESPQKVNEWNCQFAAKTALQIWNETEKPETSTLCLSTWSFDLHGGNFDFSDASIRFTLTPTMGPCKMPPAQPAHSPFPSFSRGGEVSLGLLFA